MIFSVITIEQKAVKFGILIVLKEINPSPKIVRNFYYILKSKLFYF